MPVKVHVAHKPTVEDITRVYNPYPIQVNYYLILLIILILDVKFKPNFLKNEYEKFVKDGFLFEPIKVNTKEAFKPSTNVNVSFTSDIISPYTRKDRGGATSQPPSATVMLKNPVDHDRLLDAARGNVNHAFVNDTEFRNYNQQQQQQQQQLKQTTTDEATKARRVRRSGGGGSRKSNANAQSVSAEQAIGSHARREEGVAAGGVGEMHDYERMYEDEYDVANKAVRKSNPNLQLIDSINKELKRVATGYRPDASNA